MTTRQVNTYSLEKERLSQTMPGWSVDDRNASLLYATAKKTAGNGADTVGLAANSELASVTLHLMIVVNRTVQS